MQKRNFLGFQKYYNIEGDIELDVNFSLKDNVKFKPRHDSSLKYIKDKNEFKSCWIEILIDYRLNILTGVFYRHFRKTCDNTFLEQLKFYLRKIKSRSNHIILCKDFNYDILRHAYNNFSAEFCFLQPCITERTIIVDNSSQFS